MCPTDVCTPRNGLRVPRASCVPSAGASWLSPRGSSRFPRLAPRARLRGVFRAASPPGGGDAGTGQPGAVRCEARLGDRAFHDARRPLRRVVGARAGRCLPRAGSSRLASGTPVASPGGLAADRFRPPLAPRAAKTVSARRLVKSGAHLRPGVPSFGSCSGHARTCRSTRVTPMPSSIARRSRDEDHQAPTNRLPFTGTTLPHACAWRDAARLCPRSRAPGAAPELSTRTMPVARFSGPEGVLPTSATRSMHGHELRAVCPRPRAG